MSEAAMPVPRPLGMLAGLRVRFASEGAQEMLALYAVHAATVAAPLAIVPYASRVLGPENWGVYSIFHSLALYASMLVEYGFNLSATREVARLRESRSDRARLLSEVFAAKLILALLLIVVLSIAASVIPMLSAHPLLMAGAMAFALGQGAGLVWYFQGTAQVRRVAALEVGGRVIAILFSFLLVREPADAWLLLVVNGAALVLVAAITAMIAIRDSGFHPLSWAGAVRMLKDGLSLFVFRGAVSLYTLANSFVLGMLAPAAAVGFFAGAERINKGFLGLLNPIIQAYYAKLSHAAVNDAAAMARMRKRCMIAVAGVGLALGIGVFLAAPLLVQILLGSQYLPAVRLLRILAFLLPITALNTTLGVHGLLPLGRDRAFNTVIICAGLLNITLAIALASRWQDTGMSIALVATETFVAAAFYFYLRRAGLNPFAPEQEAR